MRLIDADALRESIITRQTEMSYEDAWALTCVDNAPTIEPQKWVSCSERLPDVGQMKGGVKYKDVKVIRR